MTKVAVYIPTFNRPTLIGLTIDSILNQTLSDFKIYVLERSIGKPREIARKNLAAIKDPRLKVFYDDEFVPLGEAYNKLMFDYSDKDEEYVSIFTDDTIMHEIKMQYLTKYLDEHPNIPMAVGKFALLEKIEISYKSKCYQCLPSPIFGNYNEASDCGFQTDLTQPILRRTVVDGCGRLEYIYHGRTENLMGISGPVAGWGVDCRYFTQLYKKGYTPTHGAGLVYPYLNIPDGIIMDMTWKQTRDSSALLEKTIKNMKNEECTLEEQLYE